MLPWTKWFSERGQEKISGYADFRVWLCWRRFISFVEMGMGIPNPGNRRYDVGNSATRI